MKTSLLRRYNRKDKQNLGLDDSTEIKLKVRYGKAVIPDNLIITGELI